MEYKIKVRLPKGLKNNVLKFIFRIFSLNLRNDLNFSKMESFRNWHTEVVWSLPMVLIYHNINH